MSTQLRGILANNLNTLIGFDHYNTIEVYREVLHSYSVYIEDILVHI